jgi:hypothetical protein
MMPNSPNQMEPGSLHGLHLVVTDIAAAYAELSGKGVDAGEPFRYGEAGVPEPGVDPNHTDYATFFTFHDPDGNTWLVQEVGWAAAQA